MQNREIDILRDRVKKQLDDYHGGERVSIPIELLDHLLFEIVEVKIEGNWYKVKVPVWSGEFLAKIDLSEVSFTDVLWNYDLSLASNFIFRELSYTIQQIKSTIPICSVPPYEICYANTNAQINLTEGFISNYGKVANNTKYNGLISVGKCNFSGTDVRIGEGARAIQFLYSNFVKSGIFIPKPILFRRLYLYCTNLSGIDLKHLSIDGLSNHFYGSNFRNSGIDISLEPSKLESYLDAYELSFKVRFITMLNDYFVGCRVNGIYLDYHDDEEYNLRLILKRNN